MSHWTREGRTEHTVVVQSGRVQGDVGALWHWNRRALASGIGYRDGGIFSHFLGYRVYRREHS